MAVAVPWLVAATGLALAAAFVLRLLAMSHAAAACRAARADLAAKLDLSEAALARGAYGAVRLLPTGKVVTVGDGASAGGVFVGEGELAGEGAALVAGKPFSVPLSDTRLAVGAFSQGCPTVFVEPAARSVTAGACGGDVVDGLLRRVPFPAWAEVEGARIWANAAYAKAVGAPPGVPEAVAIAEPLLDARAAAQLGAGEGPVAHRVSTIVRGERRTLDVAAFREDGALAAFAYDLTELTRALNAHERALESHAATLDRLATAIAIFGPDRRLSFHNAAFATLWGLPAQFLEHAPREDDVLDRLRTERRLPETADFKAFKRDQLKGYETREGFERWWHLPDGQSLRVIANPGADGGVTYVYENVTEQLKLERRYNALARVQGETIDNLGEGLASFGPDGLLRLSNPAFFHLTGVTQADVGEHVRALAASAPVDAAHVFETLSGAVTGLTDHRVTKKGRLERTDGRVLDYAFSPLPDGSMLATFADVTDTVNVARALVERNNALEAGDKLKNAFIEHVSYELRSPLNTIIGFTQLLTRPQTGALSDRQREYAGYISSSSEALIVIIDGILDLATIDAGIMELSLEPVDVRASIGQVLDGLKDRVAEGSIRIETDIAEDAVAFEADAQRLRQVLFNLLSNAVSHSPKGGRVLVTGRREGEFVAIAVRDHGPGIAPEKAETVFDRFVTVGSQGRRGGVGLGLSLVKSFVELHGGTVEVRHVDGPGAEVVAHFPRPADAPAAYSKPAGVRGVVDAI